MEREKKVSTSRLKLTKMAVTSDLHVIGKIQIYLLKSSTTQRKYLLLLDDKTGAGPHTSRNKRSIGFLEIEEVKTKMQLVQLSLLTGRAYKRLLSGSNREPSPRQNTLKHRRSWMTKVMMPLRERDSFSHEGRRRTAQ